MEVQLVLSKLPPPERFTPVHPMARDASLAERPDVGFWTGPHVPDWIYSSGVPKVATDNGTFPYYSNCKRVVENGDWLRADIGWNCGKPWPLGACPLFPRWCGIHRPKKGTGTVRKPKTAEKNQSVTEPVPIFGLPAYSLSYYLDAGYRTYAANYFHALATCLAGAPDDIRARIAFFQPGFGSTALVHRVWITRLGGIRQT